MAKADNFDKVREWIRSCKKKSFIYSEIDKELKLGYNVLSPVLKSIEELGEIKYLKSYKIYVKTNDK